MFLDIGQKVVCINDDFLPIVKALYTALPVKNKTYVIRDLELGIGIGERRVPKVSLKLVGLVNPAGPPPASRERGFDSDRFVPIQPTPAAKLTRRQILDPVSDLPVTSALAV